MSAVGHESLNDRHRRPPANARAAQRLITHQKAASSRLPDWSAWPTFARDSRRSIAIGLRRYLDTRRCIFFYSPWREVYSCPKGFSQIRQHAATCENMYHLRGNANE